MASKLSSNPFSPVARLANDGTYLKDELPIASPSGLYGCALTDPLFGVYLLLQRSLRPGYLLDHVEELLVWAILGQQFYHVLMTLCWSWCVASFSLPIGYGLTPLSLWDTAGMHMPCYQIITERHSRTLAVLFHHLSTREMGLTVCLSLTCGTSGIDRITKVVVQQQSSYMLLTIHCGSTAYYQECCHTARSRLYHFQ